MKAAEIYALETGHTPPEKGKSSWQMYNSYLTGYLKWLEDKVEQLTTKEYCQCEQYEGTAADGSCYECRLPLPLPITDIEDLFEPTPTKLNKEECDLVNKGSKLRAVKAYSIRTGLGLKESKAFIDAYLKNKKC